MTEQEIRQNERNKIADLLQKGRFAPVDYYGGCLECGEWTPPNHPERWGHKSTCSWFNKEFRGDSFLANVIRSLNTNEED